jgi:hypothetical protein
MPKSSCISQAEITRQLHSPYVWAALLFAAPRISLQPTAGLLVSLHSDVVALVIAKICAQYDNTAQANGSMRMSIIHFRK